MRGPEDYGPAKVACEQHVLRAFGTRRSVILRPGIIGGPGDSSGRSAYWPARFAMRSAREEPVLIPEELDQPVQLIDVRDVAEFVVTQTDADTNRTRVPATAAWLAEHGVNPWAGPRLLPLWLGTDLSTYPMMRRKGFRAAGLGLRTRIMEETFADELATLAPDYLGEDPPSGLSDGEHQKLLSLLAQP
ncbi:hypothetical protein BH23ACT6_BH23ACT6_23550 [soil metagenome]